MASPLVQADLADALERGCARVPLACKLQRQHHVFERVEGGYEMKGLEHETYVLRTNSGTTILIELAEVVAGELNEPRARQVETCKQGEQRGFTGARRTYHRDCFPCRDGKTNIVKNGQIAFRAANLFRNFTGQQYGAGDWRLV